jgi:hypothetical protein
MPSPLRHLLLAGILSRAIAGEMTNDWKKDPDRWTLDRWTLRRMPDDEYFRRWEATEKLMDRICVLKDHYRKENIGIAAQKTALYMRGYIRSSLVVHIRRTRTETRRKLLPAPQSSVSVLRRIRHAIERDNARNFMRAMNELPDHVQRRLNVIAREVLCVWSRPETVWEGTSNKGRLSSRN